MVQEVEGRAARARALPQVPQPRRTQHTLQGVVLEPVVQQLGDRHRKDAQQIDHGLLAQAPDVEAEPCKTEQLAHLACLHVRRRLDVQPLEDAREPPHARAELRPPARVGGADPADILYRQPDGPTQLEPAAAIQGRGDPRIGLLDSQPARREPPPQLLDDLGRHPPHVQPGLRRVALLDDEDAATGAGEIVRGDEAVHVRADHDRVPADGEGKGGGRAQAPSPSTASAASRPEAPMIPPPGCVPAPH